MSGGTFERTRMITAQVKSNLDQMDQILDELRDLARESGDLSGRLTAEMKGSAADSEAWAGKVSEASGRRSG
jgi:hypothetical protein